jgi:hypothetical protein
LRVLFKWRQIALQLRRWVLGVSMVRESNIGGVCQVVEK